MDSTARNATIVDGQWGSWVGAVAGGMGTYLQQKEAKDKKYSLVGVPYPTLKKGERPLLGHFSNNYDGTNSAAISTSSKKVKEACQYLDYMYGREGHMLVNFGVEGLGYNIVNGQPKMTELALGAEGVQVGTRFAATVESAAHERYKQLVVEARDGDTVHIGPVSFEFEALGDGDGDG